MLVCEEIGLSGPVEAMVVGRRLGFRIGMETVTKDLRNVGNRVLWAFPPTLKMWDLSQSKMQATTTDMI